MISQLVLHAVVNHPDKATQPVNEIGKMFLSFVTCHVPSPISLKQLSDVHAAETSSIRLAAEDCAGIQACVAALTELLLEANGDAESEAGRCVSEVLTDWELLVGARRRYNMNGLREMFSQPPHALDPDCSLEEVGSVLSILSFMFPRCSVLLGSCGSI